MIALAIIVGFVIGAAAAWELSGRYWQEYVVKRGFAEYDSKTGNWRWKDSQTK